MTSSFFEGGPGRRTTLQQALLPWYTNIVFTHKYSEECPETVARLLRALSRQVFGFAIQLSVELGDVKIHGIAFATGDNVYHIKCDKSSVDLGGHNFAALLDSHYGLLVGFEMASQMLHVYRELDLDSIGVDISALRPARLTRSWMSSDYVSLYLGRNVDNLQIDGLFYGSSLNSDENSCLRAWLAAKVAETEWRRIQLLPRLDTRMLPKNHIDCISSLARNIEVRKYIQPTFLENEFDSIELTEGRLVVRNARFKTRIRASAKTSVHMNSGTGSTIAVGRAIHAIGKDTYIKLSNGSYNEKVQKIQVRGREEPSPFEVAQAKFIMSLLCKEITLTDRPFIDMLWLSSEPPRSYGSAPIQYALEHPAFDSLNESQCRVAAAMISDSLVITHGPPGTGKTATIAASVKYWQTRGAPVWVIAKSNVAVKNIARSLLNIDVQQFKMIVSREFFTGWHEEIYDRLRRQVVHIDNLDEAVPEIERTLGGCRVILCTMGTLSSPILDHGLFNLVPVVRLIIDEASQIDVSDFMHLLHKFDRLTKLCFFGDPKQLPPFGQDKAPDFKSIFDIQHLKTIPHFLSTQYRMPKPLGEFISRHVYGGSLETEHWQGDMSCVDFVDVSGGWEERCGTSWTNNEEVITVCHIVRHYYRNKDFCIITPYDAQRSAIQRRLKDLQLPSERVYNVDSFQGHEAAYVIVSAVRSDAPGFLSKQSRMNVMLTRCEAGMVVVTNRRFVRGVAKNTLLGKLAEFWEEHRGYDQTWISSQIIADATCDLPGIAAPRQRVPLKLKQEPQDTPVKLSSNAAVTARDIKADLEDSDHDALLRF